MTTASMAQTVPNYVPTNGLMGWWPFNGNANDESGNNNNGTVNGATLTTDRFGNANKAHEFDGINDYITIQDNSSNDLNTNFSISLWIMPYTGYGSGSAPNGINNQIISKWGLGGINNSSYQFVINQNGNAIFSTHNGSSTTSIVSTTIIPINIWHHLLVTKNSQLMKLYYDGVIIDSIINAVNPQQSNYNLSIAREGFGNYAFVKGKIDDIGIWNRALTDQEISNLYNANICYDHVTVTDTLIINANLIGFNPVTYQNTIKVWPNPAHDHITIDNGNISNLNGYQIKITNVLGQQVFQSAINQQQFYIDLSTWTGNGAYYLNLINPQGVTIETKVIVVQ